jgi:hypothetical protein
MGEKMGIRPLLVSHERHFLLLLSQILLITVLNMQEAGTLKIGIKT